MNTFFTHFRTNNFYSFNVSASIQPGNEFATNGIKFMYGHDTPNQNIMTFFSVLILFNIWLIEH